MGQLEGGATPKPVVEKGNEEAQGTPQPKVIIKGLPKLAHTISTKIDMTTREPMPSEKKEDKLLTQEEFDGYWKTTLEELSKTMPELITLLNGVKIVMGEHNEFEIEAYNGYFESEFKKYKLSLLTKLRDNSGVRGLNCKVKIVRTEQSAIIYNPADKYADMLKRNPKLVELRKLFTSLDY